MDPVQTVPIRRQAQLHIDKIPPGGLGSDDNSAAFDSFVGKAPDPYPTRQKQMEATGYKMTYCNEFAGEVARAVTKTYVGAINFKQWVLSNKSHAWIDSTSGAEPKYGDIFFTTLPHQHLGVSRGVRDGTHFTVEAGQGGIHYKQDFLKFLSNPWIRSHYSGWMDIELFMSAAPPTPAFSSPVGKWTVWGKHRTYRWTYTFSANHNVTWMDVFNGKWGSGKWSVDSRHLIIAWNSGSSDLWNLPINPSGMTGSADMQEEGKIDIQASMQ